MISNEEYKEMEQLLAPDGYMPGERLQAILQAVVAASVDAHPLHSVVEFVSDCELVDSDGIVAVDADTVGCVSQFSHGDADKFAIAVDVLGPTVGFASKSISGEVRRPTSYFTTCHRVTTPQFTIDVSELRTEPGKLTKMISDGTNNVLTELANKIRRYDLSMFSHMDWSVYMPEVITVHVKKEGPYIEWRVEGIMGISAVTTDYADDWGDRISSEFVTQQAPESAVGS